MSVRASPGCHPSPIEAMGEVHESPMRPFLHAQQHPQAAHPCQRTVLGYLPGVRSEPSLRRNSSGSPARSEIPCIINGEEVFTGDVVEQVSPTTTPRHRPRYGRGKGSQRRHRGRPRRPRDVVDDGMAGVPPSSSSASCSRAHDGQSINASTMLNHPKHATKPRLTRLN